MTTPSIPLSINDPETLIRDGTSIQGTPSPPQITTFVSGQIMTATTSLPGSKLMPPVISDHGQYSVSTPPAITIDPLSSSTTPTTPTTTTITSTTQPPSTATASHASSSLPTSSLTAAIVVPIIFVAIFLPILILWYLSRRHKQRLAQQPPPNPHEMKLLPSPPLRPSTSSHHPTTSILGFDFGLNRSRSEHASLHTTPSLSGPHIFLAETTDSLVETEPLPPYVDRPESLLPPQTYGRVHTRVPSLDALRSIRTNSARPDSEALRPPSGDRYSGSRSAGSTLTEGSETYHPNDSPTRFSHDGIQPERRLSDVSRLSFASSWKDDTSFVSAIADEGVELPRGMV